MHNRNLKYETHARAAGQQRDDGIAGAIHVALIRFGKSDATTAWGDHDTSSRPLDDWRGVSAAFVKWRGGAMTLCRKRLGVRF